MNSPATCLAGVALAAAIALGQSSIAAPPSGSTAAQAPSARDFTRVAAVQDVSVSRDGRHIVALTSADGDKVNISVWRTDDFSKPPIVIASTRIRFLNVSFIKNDRLIVTAIQTITVGATRGHLIKQFITDLEGKDFRPLLPDTGIKSEDEAFVNRFADATVIDPLPQDPRYVLAQDNRLNGNGDLYRVDVYTGAAERREHGSEKFDGYLADLKGDIRAKQELGFDGGKVYIAQWIRNPDSGAWEEHFRSYARDRTLSEVVAFTTDPNVVYVRAVRGGDKAAIYEYDIRKKTFGEPVFAHALFEAGPAVYQSTAKADYGRVLGFTYEADSTRAYWVDERLAALAKSLDGALGVARSPIAWTDPGTGKTARIAVGGDADAAIVSWSDDFASVIVSKSGPRQPDEYYLLSGGKLSLLGKSRPWIDTATLGETRLVEYPARDGLMIPAFLTTPPAAKFGPGPYPTLIEPHGGPWARDEMEWDVGGWTQYFASRGYAVLQPQFRGSEGWGQKLWRAGDGEWGQKMQDDKDDGVKWLVAQKIADPARVAMFGYSYGGYAALAAAIRPNGLYQCAISGAGAGDLASIAHATFDNRFQREFQHPTIGGLDALEHARESKIPVFLYHGDRDQTVDIAQSRKFAAALKAAGKPYRLLEIPDMGHQYITMTPAMMQTQLTEIEAFLKIGCKSGGL
jgi:dipeptidyl aminopeptidase/acylaminoacyl peptidase